MSLFLLRLGVKIFLPTALMAFPFEALLQLPVYCSCPRLFVYPFGKYGPSTELLDTAVGSRDTVERGHII